MPLASLIKLIVGGALCGFLNGLFGSGGGIMSVLFLKKILSDEREVHASSTFVMLVLSAISFVFYWNNGFVEISQAKTFIPFGIFGAVVGSSVLAEINNNRLKKIFGVLLILSGAVMLLR